MTRLDYHEIKLAHSWMGSIISLFFHTCLWEKTSTPLQHVFTLHPGLHNEYGTALIWTIFINTPFGAREEFEMETDYDLRQIRLRRVARSYLFTIKHHQHEIDTAKGKAQIALPKGENRNPNLGSETKTNTSSKAKDETPGQGGQNDESGNYTAPT